MLDVVKIFNKLANDRGIIFCHWKSNAGLEKAVNGDTDLDLLFFEINRIDVEKIFNDIGAVKFNSVIEKKYSNIDDFIFVDEEEGKLIHFHVHYQLDVGEKLVKSYHLPYADDILATRIKHPQIDFWISNHEIELILLIIRQTLRIPPFAIIRNKLPSIGHDTQSEYLWLKNSINKEELKKICYKWFPEKIAEIILYVIEDDLSVQNIINNNKSLRSYFSKYRQQSHSGVFITLYKKVLKIKLKSRIHSLGCILPLNRVMPNCGISVAFIGVDGSGKSTIAENVKTFFKKKIDVDFIYFGHGKSHKSVIIKGFKTFSKILGKFNKNIENILFSTGIALDKKSKFYKLKKSIDAGKLVVCDRFPQTNINGWCDGLRLSDYSSSNNIILKKLSRWEKKIYSLGNLITPDIIFHIIVETETAHKRKKSSDYDFLDKKNKAMKQIILPSKSKIIHLENNNVELPYLEKIIVSEIWKIIQEKNL